MAEGWLTARVQFLKKLLGLTTRARPVSRYPGESNDASPDVALRALEARLCGDAQVFATDDGGPAAARAALAQAAGLLAAGRRATVFAHGTDLADARSALATLREQHRPLLVHGDFGDRCGEGGGGGHAAYESLGRSGILRALAQSPQHALDLSVVLRALCEERLLPALLGTDWDAAAFASEPLRMPQADLLTRMLGTGDELVETPGPAQQLLFGDQRRRLVHSFDLDHRAAHGLPRNSADRTAALAGEEVFFGTDVLERFEAHCRTLGTGTGRTLGALSVDGKARAKYVVVAQGALVHALRQRPAVRTGAVSLIGIVMAEPFPAAALSELVGHAERVLVCEQSGRLFDGDDPLTLQVRAAAGGAAQVLSAHCGVGETVPTGVELDSALDNLRAPRDVRPRLWLGVAPSDAAGAPKRQARLARLARDYPRLQSGSTGVAACDANDGVEAVVVPDAARNFVHASGDYAHLARFHGEVLEPRLHAPDAVRAADPQLSLGATPAFTSALKPRRPAQAGSPRIRLEQCSGCGECWSGCPDAALGVSLFRTQELLDAALGLCGAPDGSRYAGAGKLGRAHKRVAAQLESSLARHDARTLQPATVSEAYADVLGKLKLTEKDRALLDPPLGAVTEQLAALPIAATPRLFHEPRQADPTHARLMVLAVDPLSCTECGLCASVCPEDAIEMPPVGAQPEPAAGEGWRQWQRLPDTSGDTIALLSEIGALDPLAAVMSSRHGMFALAPGGESEPGSGSRLALRQLAAALEHRQQQKLNARIEATTSDLGKLRDRVVEMLTNVNRSTELGALSEALRSTPDRPENYAELVRALERSGQSGRVDAAMLSRLVDTSQQLTELEARLSRGPDGVGRARFGLVMSRRLAPCYPDNPFSVPVEVCPDEEAPDRALGLGRVLSQQNLAEARLRRQATLLLEPPPDLRAQLDALAELEPDALSPEERAQTPPVVVVLDAASLSGAALAGLTRVLRSDLPIVVVLLDDASTLLGGLDASSFGLSMRSAFVLSTSIAHHTHLFRGVQDALEHSGPALLHVLAPNPAAADLPTNHALARARLAVECRVQPLLRYDPHAPGAFSQRVELEGNPATAAALCHDTTGKALTAAHFALDDARFADQLGAPGTDETTPISEWLALDDDARGSRRPTIDAGSGETLLVGTALARAVAERHQGWAALQELAGVSLPYAERIRAGTRDELERAHAQELEQLRQQHERALHALAQEHRDAHAKQLRDRLLVLAGYPARVHDADGNATPAHGEGS